MPGHYSPSIVFADPLLHRQIDPEVAALPLPVMLAGSLLSTIHETELRKRRIRPVNFNEEEEEDHADRKNFCFFAFNGSRSVCSFGLHCRAESGDP
jgi:hypothetical protein